jgi:hypothetical protein
MFKYIGENSYKAEIQLPDDGCPGSEQHLEIAVNIDE